jgi:hypothetical protein
MAQVEPEGNGGAGEGSPMAVPPPVSNQSYPTAVGSEMRSNYLRMGVSFATSYINNFYTNSANPLSETTYAISPTISYEQTTPRQSRSFTYSPGFTFYHPSSSLNEVDHDLTALYQYRLTQHLTINANDALIRSSTYFGDPNSATGGAVSGSPQPVTPGITVPFAERLTNAANVDLSYQFSPSGMIGGAGTWDKLDYPNPSEVTGLYNSDSRGGSAFYNRRISASEYIGTNYQYSMVIASPQGDQDITQTNTIYAFYSIYLLQRRLSLSISGGPQHYSITQPLLPPSNGWNPMLMASMGWQGTRTNVALSYSRQVTAGGGLLGAFTSESGNISSRWQMRRTLTAGLNGTYANNKAIAQILNASVQNGHTISGAVTAQYTISPQLTMNGSYDRIHQSYSGVAAVAGNPNSGRVTVSLSWQFLRPLGR